MIPGKGSSFYSLIRPGLPFIGGLVALAFMVGSMADTRHRLHRIKSLQSNAYYDASMKIPDAPKMLNDMLGNRDIDNWDNLRGPRPWEDSRAMQTEQRKVQSK
ncbi:hypothetical protein BOX15_Mlig012850g2 [Macrostomum lignano]|uniref:Uncharacterized protein n=1 Tax=Macrostomum lignano TaxID=282301 RepID=A0A267GKW2_9PLAT|nr:hypothetical protein BOX15_Mlig012850g1 [Macrostomum lignano]PAA79234.1 hypothetical protein BOX15_Mlig012850g3 [Macrostomum lignano]PAA86057.1 hypothetical protein BOX15_Mlig012850g2 [Macrostomum lignano]